MNDALQGLTTTSYAVLAQLAVHPWSTYELAQQRVRYFRYVWPRAESAIYREVKRLAAMRLVAARREYVGKRPRTVYSIAEAGRQVLSAWLDTPVSPFAMDFEAMIRLFIAPLGTKEQLVATLEQVRGDAQEMLRFGGAVDTDRLAERLRALDEALRRAADEVESRLSRTLVQLGNARDALREHLGDAGRVTQRLLQSAEGEGLEPAPPPALQVESA